MSEQSFRKSAMSHDFLINAERWRQALVFVLIHFFLMLSFGAIGIAPSGPDPTVRLTGLWNSCYNIYWVLCAPFRPEFIVRTAETFPQLMGFLFLANSLIWGLNFACYQMLFDWYERKRGNSTL